MIEKCDEAGQPFSDFDFIFNVYGLLQEKMNKQYCEPAIDDSKNDS